MTSTITGGCHCGNLKLTFHTSRPFEDLPIRACQCTFCRKHNSRATADPDGRLEISVADHAALGKYRFGLGITDFLLCGSCGVYVAATIEDAASGGLLATVVVNALDIAQDRIKPAVAATYDSETEAERRARRAERWMPAAFV